jgi:hypothetical protein
MVNATPFSECQVQSLHSREFASIRGSQANCYGLAAAKVAFAPDRRFALSQTKIEEWPISTKFAIKFATKVPESSSRGQALDQARSVREGVRWRREPCRRAKSAMFERKTGSLAYAKPCMIVGSNHKPDPRCQDLPGWRDQIAHENL